MGTRSPTAVSFCSLFSTYRFDPRLEQLESRQMLSGDVRTIDGTDNNPFHDNWGATGVQLLRQGPAAYGDSVSSPGGVGRPDARTISNTVAADPVAETLNDR